MITDQQYVRTEQAARLEEAARLRQGRRLLAVRRHTRRAERAALQARLVLARSL